MKWDLYLVNTVDAVVGTNIDAVGQFFVAAGGGGDPVVILHGDGGRH